VKLIESYRTVQRPAALPGVEIHRGHHPGGGPCGRFHTQYAFGTIDGPLRYSYRGRSRERDGQYVVLVQSGEFRPEYICGPLSFQHWYIAPELMREAAEDRGQSGVPRFSRQVTEDPRIYQLVTCATAALTNATGGLKQQKVFTSLIGVILGEYADPRQTTIDVIAHRAVRRMRDLIQDRYGEELTLDMLSSYAGLNKFYALRAFKRAVGVTPHTYLRHVRLEKGRQMLRAGISSTEVAHALGFCDQSHFVRTFRQMTFITPRQYQLAA
jgi:AraC-like DNA-binding protein